MRFERGNKYSRELAGYLMQRARRKNLKDGLVKDDLIEMVVPGAGHGGMIEDSGVENSRQRGQVKEHEI